MDFKGFLKKAKEIWDLIGFLWPALVVGATAAVGWIAKAPSWARVSAVAAAALLLLAGLAWRIVRLSRELGSTKRQLAIAGEKAGALAHHISGANWPAEGSLIFELLIPQQRHAVTIKGHGGKDAWAEVDLQLRARVVSPIAVTVKQFSLKLVCIGPGVTASGTCKELTGWTHTQPRTAADFHVTARLEGQFGLEKTENYARVGVEGTVVVSSAMWKWEDRVVPLPDGLSGLCLIFNEIPEGKRLRQERVRSKAGSPGN